MVLADSARGTWAGTAAPLHGMVQDARELFRDRWSELDRLHQERDVPFTGRRLWLQAWVDNYADYLPTAVTVMDPRGSLAGVALFGLRRRRGYFEVVAMGHGPSDIVALPARPEAATPLASAIADWLRGLGKPWHIDLENLELDDAVSQRLSDMVPHVRRVAGEVSPVLLAQEKSLDEHVSASHRKRLRALHRAMGRDGLEPRVQHLRRRAEVHAALDEVERVFRARDLSVGRACPLDEASFGGFFRQAVLALSDADQLRLTTLDLGGELAAYALCFVDGATYRMWNCRFHPRWHSYSPGRVAIDAAVANALADGAGAFDFMRGQEAYKSSYANTEYRSENLSGWSGGLVTSPAVLVGRGRDWATAADHGATASLVVAAAKRLRASGG